MAIILLLMLVTALSIWGGIYVRKTEPALSNLFLSLGTLLGILLLGGFYGFIGG